MRVNVFLLFLFKNQPTPRASAVPPNEMIQVVRQGMTGSPVREVFWGTALTCRLRFPPRLAKVEWETEQIASDARVVPIFAQQYETAFFRALWKHMLTIGLPHSWAKLRATGSALDICMVSHGTFASRLGFLTQEVNQPPRMAKRTQENSRITILPCLAAHVEKKVAKNHGLCLLFRATSKASRPVLPHWY